MTNAYVAHAIVVIAVNVVRQSRNSEGSIFCTIKMLGAVAAMIMAQLTNILRMYFVALNCGTKRFEIMMFEDRISNVDAPKLQ